ncbi:hypothetical protein M405DRAFT_844491 [Rhizopogon salebrosus TDB-379]|nr:hypothetical protein M405DRAFT_844491 [Rhizopogon salebrosus TDB-379]
MKENMDPGMAAVTVKAEKKRTVLVAWSKPENHHLTDSLLTLIEDSNTYRKAFGFALLSSKVPSTGDRPIDLCRQLAAALFLDREDSQWKDADINDLADTVKNRVTNDIFNAWDKVKKKFPWYKRMNSLYRESPVVDRSAVANSTSQLDLTVLDRSQVADNDGAPTEDDGVPIDWPASPGRYPGESDEFAKDDDGSSIIITPPPSPSRKPVIPASLAKSEPPPSVHRGSDRKRKSMHSHIEDLTTSLGEARVKVAQVREREQTLRTQAKEERKKAEFDSHLQFRAAEAERQRMHELAMLERQIELERLRSHAHSTAAHFAAPPPFLGPPSGPPAGPSID